MRLWGPRAMLGCRTREDYAKKQAATVAALHDRFEDGRAVHAAARPAVAYVNHGRWVVDCAECAAGAAVDVQHGEARCFDCGAVYAAADASLVLPPADVVAWLDDALGLRPAVHTRNWMPGESLAAIAVENRRHGIAGKGAV